MTNLSVVDVASYILAKYDVLTTMKLQKLTYYCQAQYLTRYSIPLFDEDFQAWRGGPVCVALYEKHKGLFLISSDMLPVQKEISGRESEVIDSVCEQLGSLTGNELSKRTHSESPWITMRQGLNPEDPGVKIIDKELMKSYYSKNPIIG